MFLSVNNEYRQDPGVRAFTERIRIPMLFLTPVGILLGAACAFRSLGHIPQKELLYLLTGAVSGHLAVYDFRDFANFQFGRRIDARTVSLRSLIGTPPADMRSSIESLVLSILFASISIAACIYFARNVSNAVFLYWAAGLFCLAFYRSFLHRLPFAVLLVPGAGFGPVLVCMSYFILTGRNSLTALLASMLIFFMVNNLFLLSQFDEHVATWWRGLSFRSARRVSGIMYASFWTLAYVSVVVGCATHRFPDMSMATWLTYYFAVPAAIGAVRFSFDIEKMIPFENQSIALCLATPLILSLTLIFG